MQAKKKSCEPCPCGPLKVLQNAGLQAGGWRLEAEDHQNTINLRDTPLRAEGTVADIYIYILIRIRYD